MSKREANKIILSGHPETMGRMTLQDLLKFVTRASNHGASLDEVPSIRVDFKGQIKRITVTIENTPFNYSE